MTIDLDHEALALSREDIDYHAEMHLINAIAFALAKSSEEAINDLARQMHCQCEEYKMLTIKNIINRFDGNQVILNLFHGGRFQMQANIMLKSLDEDTLPVNVTIQ